MPLSDSTKTAIAVGAGAGLMGIGLYLGTRKPGKSPGDKLTAIVRFTHQGRGESIWAGIGYAAAKLLGHNPIEEWYYVDYTVPDESEGKHSVSLETKVPQLSLGKYDILVFIQSVGGELDPGGKGFKVTRWYEDQLLVK